MTDRSILRRSLLPLIPLAVSTIVGAQTHILQPSHAQGPMVITNAGLVPLSDLTGQGAMGGGTPPNDNCADAVINPLAAGASVTLSGDNTGATDEFGYGNSVYEAFTTTECLDVTISYCGTAPAFGGAFTFLFRNCPLDNLIYIPDDYISATACGDGNFTLTFPQVPPGTYYYGVLQYEDATGPYQLTFSAAACSDVPPVNDDCVGAIELVSATGCTFQQFDVFGAPVSGGSLPPSACGALVGDAADDVWFSFVATNADHTVVVEPSQGFYVTVEVRSGGCDGAIIGCAATEPGAWVAQQSVEVTGLTVGETYHVRVYDWYAGLPLTTTFGICVIGEGAVCGADAGSLSFDNVNICLENGVATVEPTPGGDAVVPTGFSTLYILARANDMVILDLGTVPSFGTTYVGDITVHTLIYDPTTLDLGFVEVEVTTVMDIDVLLLQGGGSICGALDLAGAEAVISECTAILDSPSETPWSIIPNPNDGHFQLIWPAGDRAVGMQVSDLTGRVVYEQGMMVGARGATSVDLSGAVLPGQYLVRLLVPGGTSVRRLVIQR